MQLYSSDPFARGLEYLYLARSLALDAEMVDLMFDLERRSPICSWIGDRIEQVNGELQELLLRCHQCFHSDVRPAVQILAVPLASRFGIDGLCNLDTSPMTLLIDVGRVVRGDWLALVAHEYAHAQAGFPGHHDGFARSLSHLCLGLAIGGLPLGNSLSEDQLRVYPPYRSTDDSLAFWRGDLEVL